MTEKAYIAIDLKSFYASVECREQGLDPLKARLVVADESRTEKTICLAVSPALKAYGIPGRARLFEVIQKARQAKIDFITAVPRMSLYVKYSTQIYNIYLKYVSSDDVVVYSIDEVFIDATSYLSTYNMTAKELAMAMIKDVLKETGITATAGIGTNLYLAKIAMDIVAKKMPADENGVRIAELDERSYREKLWDHTPIRDFWRVGGGYAKKLAEVGLFTMGDIARCSIGKEKDYYNEDLLYKLFGINAELLIDHAWGYEPVTIEDIKAYKPQTNSLSTGQVLHCPYDFEKTKLVVKEMTDSLCLDLVSKGFVTDQLVLNIGYDIENIKNSEILKKYSGEVVTDHYGRRIPKHSHGTINLAKPTASSAIIIGAVLELFDKIVNPDLLVRRINVVAAKVITEQKAKEEEKYEQLDLFSFGLGYDDASSNVKAASHDKTHIIAEKEKKVQEAVLKIKDKYGKNAVLKGMNFEEGATAKDRNAQIGGHKA